MKTWTRPRVRTLRFGALCAGALLLSVLSTWVPSAAVADTGASSAPSPGYALPAHVPYYVVPDNQNVFAYALAAQLLGDGNRDTQIFQLNQGRQQPTGDAWNQLSTVEPGWYLILPCDATGSDAGVSVQWNPPPQDVPPGQIPASASCPASAGPTDTPVPAGTAVIGAGTYQLINANSGLALALAGGSTKPGTKVVQAVPGAALGQQWRLSVINGQDKLVNVASGLVLEVPSLSKSAGSQLDQWTSSAGLNQRWTVGSLGGGYFTLTNVNSGLLADDHNAATAPGTTVIQWRADEGPDQEWKFVPVPGPSAPAATQATKTVATGKGGGSNGSTVLILGVLMLLVVAAGGFGWWRWRTAGAVGRFDRDPEGPAKPVKADRPGKDAKPKVAKPATVKADHPAVAKSAQTEQFGVSSVRADHEVVAKSAQAEQFGVASVRADHEAVAKSAQEAPFGATSAEASPPAHVARPASAAPFGAASALAKPEAPKSDPPKPNPVMPAAVYPAEPQAAPATLAAAPTTATPATPASPAAPAKPAAPRTGLSRLGRRKPPPVTDALLADPRTLADAALALARLTPGASWWPYAVAVGEDRVTVWLAGMELPAPSGPWQAVDGDTRAWTMTRAELAEPTDPVDPVDLAEEQGPAAEDPVLAVLGVLGDTVAVLEFSHSHGVLAVGGDPRWAPQVHESLVGQLLGGEVLLRTPGEADPVGGRPHWALDVDGEGWVTVHGRRVRFAAPPEPGEEATETESAPTAAEGLAPLASGQPQQAVSGLDLGHGHDRGHDRDPDFDPDLGSIAVSAQPGEPGPSGAAGAAGASGAADPSGHPV